MSKRKDESAALLEAAPETWARLAGGHAAAHNPHNRRGRILEVEYGPSSLGLGTGIVWVSVSSSLPGRVRGEGLVSPFGSGQATLWKIKESDSAGKGIKTELANWPSSPPTFLCNLLH